MQHVHARIERQARAAMNWGTFSKGIVFVATTYIKIRCRNYFVRLIFVAYATMKIFQQQKIFRFTVYFNRMHPIIKNVFHHQECIPSSRMYSIIKNVFHHQECMPPSGVTGKLRHHSFMRNMVECSAQNEWKLVIAEA